MALRWVSGLYELESIGHIEVWAIVRSPRARVLVTCLLRYPILVGTGVALEWFVMKSGICKGPPKSPQIEKNRDFYKICGLFGGPLQVPLSMKKYPIKVTLAPLQFDLVFS